MHKLNISLIVLIFFSCCNVKYNSNKHYDSLTQFKEEISNDMNKKLIKMSPYEFSQNITVDSKYYNYFKMFKNSGINILYKCDDIDSLFKKYNNIKLLQKEFMNYNKEKYVYEYNTKYYTNLKLPEIDEVFDVELLLSLQENDYKVYLLDYGQKEEIFKNDKTKYSYSLGLYYFKSQKKIVYWMLFYN